jgi:phage shock protein C
MDSHDNRIALPLRPHTILGVCEAIGEDFRFNPVLLRILLATMVVASPTWAFATYFALGAVVLVSRILFPHRDEVRPASVTVTPANEQNELAKAA